MSALPPYFFSESLKRRFAQDILDAVDASRISDSQRQWLQLLVNEPQIDSVFPRVDRFVKDDGGPFGSELAGALLISDANEPQGPLFLSTQVLGIERFESRSSLFAALKSRFRELDSDSVEMDVERIETPLFEAQTRSIMRQQASHLERLMNQLQELPDLRTAMGKSLSARLPEQGPGKPVDVFSHPVQLVISETPSDVVGTRSLVDIAVEDYVAQTPVAGISRQYLDARGQALSEEQSLRYRQALSETVTSVGGAYEQCLTAFWDCVRESGQSVQEFMTDALAESFRQHLLSGRSDGSLTEEEFRHLRALLPASEVSPASARLRVRRLSIAVGGSEPVKLIGLFILSIDDGSSGDVLLYSPLNGFVRFANTAHVTEHFTSVQGRSDLLLHSSLNDHSLLTRQGLVELHLDETATPFFFEYLDAVIGLQKRNVRHVTSRSPSGHGKAPVEIDDALDIRSLIDARLLDLHDPVRWSSGQTHFEALRDNPVVPIEADYQRTWAGKLKNIESLYRQVSSLHAGVDGCMRRALSRYLALAGGVNLEPDKLWLVPSADEMSAVPLLFWALDRVCRQELPTFNEGVVMRGELAPDPAFTEPRLPLKLLDQMLECVLPEFATRFEKQVSSFHFRQIRDLNTCVQPSVLMMMVRESSMRLELAMGKRLGTLTQVMVEMFQQVLDRPLPTLREVLGDERVDAYTLTLQYASPGLVIALPNAFILYKPRRPAISVIWILGRGLKTFDSFEDAQRWVVSQALDNSSSLLDLLSEPDRQAIDNYLNQAAEPDIKVERHRIEGHFIQALQQMEVERQRGTVVHLYQKAIERKLTPSLFCHSMAAIECDDANRHALTRLGEVIQDIVYQTQVPKWVNDTPTAEQVALIDSIQRFYVTCVEQKDFLFGLPSFYEYARGQLIPRLEKDFPGETIEPDDVTVTLTHYVVGGFATGEVPMVLPAATERVSQGLIEYAVNRLMARYDGAFSVTVKGSERLQALVTAEYVRDMTGELDVAAGYRRLMGSILVESDPDYAERRSLFYEQIPAMDLLRGMTAKLKNELSREAFDLIEAVLTMPDGLARLTVRGRRVLMSPLRLLPASQGWPSTRVINAYVIAGARSEPGPWVLYRPLNGDDVFNEYPDEAALLNDIRSSSRLQAFILDRVDPQMRKVFDQGGFMEPHLPFSVESDFDVPFDRPQPVTLDFQFFEGNALKLIFDGAIEALQVQLTHQSVTSSELRIARARFLFGLLVEQTLPMVPGGVGALMGIAQSESLLGQSIVSAQERRWGEAVAQFMAALAVLITSSLSVQTNERQAFELPLTDEVGEIEGPDDALEEIEGSEDVVAQLERAEGNTENPMEVPPFPEFSWANNSMTQQIRARLRQFEMHDVALNALYKDELFNTYNDLDAGRKYAAIDGKVYELRSDQEGWFIIGKDSSGPAVVLDKDQRWKLDLQGGLKGGGGVLTRIKSSQIDAQVDDVMAVDTEGMPSIRRTFRGMAVAIEEGHAQAQRYLETCLDNLGPAHSDAPVDPRLQKIVGEFFSVKTPDAWLYDAIRSRASRIYEALMDPSLSPIDSPRYVIGVNRTGQEASSAFVFVSDPQRRIYLTEQFFRLPSYRLKARARRSENFRFGSHYHASILIHELSHLELGTEDIAYVDAHAPFTDLLEDTAGYRMRLKNQQITLQQKTLSYQTDRSMLFKQEEGGRWRDLRRAEGDSKKIILRITRKKTLEEARDVFYADVEKRVEIMLSNADSLALLVTLLGRKRFAP
ncbi:dermonecrotic toxin domain-containing protein [Pseudomonas viridiflava]|uniref:dermonecrotic toxin domain-containing protein n=1 Tax=Pseudomonas viridiflava TaxID=33069 RepID=UPI0020BDCF02|nr:DUF6543 domain-containing protein [Pseudomonas viridiflava]